MILQDDDSVDIFAHRKNALDGAKYSAAIMDQVAMAESGQSLSQRKYRRNRD